MKKILALLLILAMTFSLASCNIQETINNIFGKGNAHTHEYKITSTDATCTEGGTATFTCSCGESYTDTIGALDHDYYVFNHIAPKCTKSGSTVYLCSRCGDRYSEKTEKTGHIWEEGVEASRLICCVADGCLEVKLGEGNGKYAEDLVFKYFDEDKAAFAAKVAEITEAIEAAGLYDPELHGFAETGELAEEYAAFEELFLELEDLLYYAMAQTQIAQISYYCNVKDAEIKAVYDEMSEYYTGIVGEFYSFSEPVYLSKYREFFYEGLTEEEILAYIAESGNYSNEEFLALKTANDKLETDYMLISNPESGSAVLEIYHQLVANNKAIAELMGYDNYVEYAYDAQYGRDYTAEDVEDIIKYVKQYLAPLYTEIYDKWNSLVADVNSGKITNSELTEYYIQFDYSFFEKYAGNKNVNDYIDLLVFNEGTANSISFSDEFNKLIGDGNMFRGTYEGAYETYIHFLEIPMVYYGAGYDNPFTVVHEFGHYMNDIYSKSQYNQSYDLLEMHSQGNEMLYLNFLGSQLSENGFALVEKYQLVNMLYAVMAGVTVDAFERAVYTGVYSGADANSIMADGVISSNEYDALYKSILKDFGIQKYFDASYWRYATVLSPCYYISYAISAIAVMPLYYMAEEDFDAAADAYLRLFTYTDTYAGDDYTDMTTVEILEYAGLYSFLDEELYKYLGRNMR